MNNYTPKPNTFSLFFNEKGDNPNRPDYKGDVILPDGTKMRMSAWMRESKAGMKYLSGKLEPMQDQRGNAVDLTPQASDLPF
jgi:uncharacterized protein (DUF736 family)